MNAAPALLTLAFSGPSPPAPLPPATHTPWTNIGPWNIGDDVDIGGEAGTIAPAVSTLANPDVIYMGGNNNAASPSVLKSTDRGRHWTKMGNGIFDTRLFGLMIVDDMGEHVLAGTPSGVFETLDGAKTWTHVKQTQSWGVANSFKNGTINGKPYVLVGANAGLGNVPLLPGKAARRRGVVAHPVAAGAQRVADQHRERR